MTREEYIIASFILIDDELKNNLFTLSIRKRGFSPSLSDSEVICMEIVGEFLGMDTDKSIYLYFKTHWSHFFPCLKSRSSFVRQSANLYAVKEKLQEKMCAKCGAYKDNIHIIDGFPISVCKFGRAHFSKLFRDEADYGFCASKKEHYYGFKGCLTVSMNGCITTSTFAEASTDERHIVPELVEKMHGLLIGDRGYISQELKDKLLHDEAVILETPLRNNMKETREPHFLQNLFKVRKKVETVISQLTCRFHIEKVWSRDLWHMTNRFVRKILSHTIALNINIALNHEPLQFDSLIHL